MANETYTLVGDNQTPAEWTDVNDVTPDQKVLIGTIDEKSGNMKAEWRPSSQAAVFIEKTITENGVYDPQQENADGYSMVTVTTPTAVLGTKTVTANGTYVATDDNKDGYSEVTVNIAQVNNAKVGASPAAFDPRKNMLEIAIPEGVTSIASSAFAGATDLTSVTLPSTLTSIGDMAFRYAAITSITLPSALTTISDNAFDGCASLTAIEIPSSVTTIKSNAFKDTTSLTTITIHKAEGSITGSPWGAGEGTQIIWDGE